MFNLSRKAITPLEPMKLFMGFLLFLLLLILLLPTLQLFSGWFESDPELWQHFADTLLPELVSNTLLLLLGVTLGTLLLGVGLAWLVVMVEFPGRKTFSWLLLLPFAMPAYVLAFVFLGLIDYSGPLQQGLAQIGWQPIDIREGALAPILVLSLVFYPYVYILSKTAFANQSTSSIETARSLGCGAACVFWRISVPLARPAIAAGLGLALMETLADFGAVSLFNFATFTTAIYSAWEDFRSLALAAQLSTLVLFLALLLLGIERLTRGKRRFTQQSKITQPPFEVSKAKQWLLTGFFTSFMMLALGLPLIQLAIWAAQTLQIEWDKRYWDWLANTLLLSVMAVSITVTAAVFMSSQQVQYPKKRWLQWVLELGKMGYALPGIVLAIGVMGVLTQFNQTFNAQLMMGGLWALLLAYLVRFMAVAHGPVYSRFLSIKPSIIEAARNMGASKPRLVWQIYLPLLKPGLLSAALLVFLDVSKELPATYLLRPFGWETLAIRIYELSADGLYERAAVPSLVLLGVGFLGLWMMKRFGLIK
ncbi:ABC transporter permease [Thiosulfativibrio zosterae]|uniref:Iron ABC transporter substrate-binding protein n=1 Tax=Thiosulfativibrio zosterae TaxID=2675053 RepID=A0A6F8PQ78_9GAMM|nr:iron ABC transporter permease [Thiosulfativibrio zosterae]BBP44150.1 iron ABC transporter substrate-binding protein [Thiosulfativibrio zosterae]